MKQILFVTACMRGPEQSRTWRLSQAFLAACRTRWPEAAVKEMCIRDRPWIWPCAAMPRSWPAPVCWTSSSRRRGSTGPRERSDGKRPAPAERVSCEMTDTIKEVVQCLIM